MASVEDVLRAARLDVRTHGANVGREYINIDCPFCGETRKHCGVHETEGYFHCWVCNESGGWGRLARRLKQFSPSTDFSAVDLSGATRYLDVTYERTRPDIAGSVAPFESLLEPGRLTDYEYDLWAYLVDDRGFEPELLDSIRPLVGLTNGAGQDLYGYVAFPYGAGEVTARRALDRVRGPRWWQSARGGVWGLEHVSDGCEWITLCEGVFDALSAPYGHAVAVLGSVVGVSWLSPLVESMPRSVGHVVLAFDRGVKRRVLNDTRLALGDFGIEVSVWDWGEFDAGRGADLDELRLDLGREPIRDYLLGLVGVLDDDLTRPLL